MTFCQCFWLWVIFSMSFQKNASLSFCFNIPVPYVSGSSSLPLSMQDGGLGYQKGLGLAASGMLSLQFVFLLLDEGCSTPKSGCFQFTISAFVTELGFFLVKSCSPYSKPLASRKGCPNVSGLYHHQHSSLGDLARSLHCCWHSSLSC